MGPFVFPVTWIVQIIRFIFTHNNAPVIVWMLVAMACSKRTASEETFLDSTDILQSDSSTITSNKSDSLFIGFVYKFYGTDDYYTDAFFKRTDESDLPAKYDDSIISHSDVMTRIALRPTGNEYFELEGLKNVDVYDSLGQPVGKAAFKRLERVNTLIDSYFAVVFTVEKLNGVPAFCIGKNRIVEMTKDFKYVKSLQKDTTGAITIHLDIQPNEQTLTIVSTSSVRISDGFDKVLYETHDEIMTDILPIPIESHGRPLLLATFAQPETDVEWSALLRFDGKQYRYCRGSRF